MLGASAAAYILHPGTIDGVRALGFPDSFRVQLAVLKALGALALVVPSIPVRVKEWAYAGTGLFLVTAIVAHTAHGDPIGLTLVNVAFLALLAVSNLGLHRMGT